MMTIKNSKYTHRLLARIVVEAKTPLAIGSGDKSIMTDALAAVDVNGLPYLPASSIAGVLRSMLCTSEKDDFWGYQSKETGHGSEITFTEGKILNSQAKVVDGLQLDASKDELLKYYEQLPIRQHVRIGHDGVKEDKGKFDEQVVYAGTRFCFEVEIAAKEADKDRLNQILETLQNANFRLGGGTRNGFGRLGVREIKTRHLNLSVQEDLGLYLQKSSNLAESADWWKKHHTPWALDSGKSAAPISYTLTLCPRDFIFFGSGFGDESGDADMTTVKERRVEWKDGKGSMSENLVLIPATSVKGALRHRVAYHYNKKKHRWAKPGMSAEKLIELSHPQAVEDLFGYEHNGKTRPGHVYFSDIIKGKAISKLLNHVKIDRFTGGTIDGALFTEQVDYLPKNKDNEYEMTISIDRGYDDEDLKYAFERALDDICEGFLPLGGGVNRGNGIFTGTRNPK